MNANLNLIQTRVNNFNNCRTFIGSRAKSLRLRHFKITAMLIAFLLASSVHAIQKCTEVLIESSANLPRGFLPIKNPQEINSSNIKSSFEQVRRQALAFKNLDPSYWKKIIPNFVYSNAVVKPGSPFIKPLKSITKQKIFWHGTTKEGADGIAEIGPWLTSGVGGISAGFFLDIHGDISVGYANKGGVMMEIFVDPMAKVFEWTGDQRLQEYFIKWLTDYENRGEIEKLYPEFYKLARGRPDLVARDNIARSFGAQILINRTLYGQNLEFEMVILDPMVVKGYRIINQK